MKIKITSNFNEETGVSLVKLQTNIGTFFGIANMAEEDKDFSSKFFGCRLAEMRATREYYLTLEKKLKTEAKGMKQICNSIENSITATDKNDLRPALRIALTNYNKKMREAAAAHKVSEKINEMIKVSIEERDKYIQSKETKDKNI